MRVAMDSRYFCSQLERKHQWNSIHHHNVDALACLYFLKCQPKYGAKHLRLYLRRHVFEYQNPEGEIRLTM